MYKSRRSTIITFINYKYKNINTNGNKTVYTFFRKSQNIYF